MLRSFIVCENGDCKRVIPILAAELVELANGTKIRVCQRCLQRLEKRDTREYLEE